MIIFFESVNLIKISPEIYFVNSVTCTLLIELIYEDC